MTDRPVKAGRRRRPLTLLLGLLAALWGSALAAPQLLAFPYRAEIGSTTVYSEAPLRAGEMRAVLDRAERLARRMGISDPAGTRLFLTDGGWRWSLLALTSRGAFAYTRPISTIASDAVIVNRADPAADMAYNGRTVGGRRQLSGVIAHERTHILMGRKLGLVRSAMLPAWQREGYADYVAGESSLSDADYARLKRAGAAHPALPYVEGRKRIEAMARTRGGTIAALFGADGKEGK